MLVTQRRDTPLDEYLAFIHTCSEAGITSVQLREKAEPFDKRLQMGLAIKRILDPLQIPLIINDDIKLALALDASGVHLGQTDGHPRLARNALGPNKLIGVSVDTLDQLMLANELPINYVGVGAIFTTKNKPDVTTLWGLDGLKTMAHQSLHPVVGIGGIHEDNAADVLSCGADGIAVISALHDAKHPGDIARLLHQTILTGVKHHDRCT